MEMQQRNHKTSTQRPVKKEKMHPYRRNKLEEATTTILPKTKKEAKRQKRGNEETMVILAAESQKEMAVRILTIPPNEDERLTMAMRDSF
jgi:hypothetical protein